MKRLFIAIFILLLAGCTKIATTTKPSTDITSAVSPTPVTAQLPENWDRFKDNVIGYSIGYPREWYPSPATAIDAESAVYSFDYKKSNNPSVNMPANEIKVAVVRFDNRNDPYDKFIEPPSPDSILETQDITVGGEDANWIKEKGAVDGISVWLMHNNVQYIISTIPANSSQLETFKTMLSTFKFEPALQLTNPKPLTTVSSPLKINGEITGTWFFEGQVVGELKTAQGQSLAVIPLRAQGEWMTEDNVPFSGTMEFTVPKGVTQGELYIKNDNPSGLTENERSVRIPLNF